jgi:hypothetical protein
MHIWGDDWFEAHGDELYDAMQFIQEDLYKYSRCRLICKEKYGTIRYEWLLPPYGALFYRNKVHRWWLNSWLYYKWTAYGYKCLRRAVYKAILKWPHLYHEIRWGLPELNR